MGFFRNKSFPFYKQLNEMDCGPACIKMIAKYYGKTYKFSYLQDRCNLTREGVSLLGISKCAEEIGFSTFGAIVSYGDLKDATLPCIVHWDNQHFVVVWRISKNKVYIADPIYNLVVFKKEEFLKHWQQNSEDLRGIALFLETTEKFYNIDGETEIKSGLNRLFPYISKHKRKLLQLFYGLIGATIIQVILPFLTKSIVDIGIAQRNLNFIYLVLIAQVSLFIGRSIGQIIRNWILLNVGAQINIQLIADFLNKLLLLPSMFFQKKTKGDILQRLNDQQRIEGFLTSGTLTTLFSFISFIVFNGILVYYNQKIFLVFLLGSILYVLWVVLFLKRRRELDYKRFTLESVTQSKVLQMVEGFDEIKLHNAELERRWSWEATQIKLYNVSKLSLSLEIKQSVGSEFINQLKNIVITVFAAHYVIKGEMTLGTLIAIQYIVGQLETPLVQFVGFVQQAQDTSISMDRLGEIQEEPEDTVEGTLRTNPDLNGDIEIKDLDFFYGGIGTNKTLDSICFRIETGKTTAIVGPSGSGKTTLLKILLRSYLPSNGKIGVNGHDLKLVEPSAWRKKCGAVLQNGYIFSDSIQKNITMTNEKIDYSNLEDSLRIANIEEMIERLPLDLQTKIGSDGIGLSQGQKQRILIARAVYKRPDYLFFDEATNALDAQNERIIVENLQEFMRDRTFIVVAHRLSTVKNADKIVVIDKGKLVEEGSHAELIANKAMYYSLIRDQLELGG